MAKTYSSIKINNVDFYYSYNTLVAVKYSNGLKVSENIWSRTTGKHLNEICSDKKSRLTRDEFKKEVTKAMKEAKLKELPLVNY